MTYTDYIALFEQEAASIRASYDNSHKANAGIVSIIGITARDEALEKCLFAIELLHKYHKKSVSSALRVGQSLDNVFI